MAELFIAQRPQENYVHQLNYLFQLGDPVAVRGRETIEILNCTTQFNHPQDCCILIPGRRWNPWLAMSEGLWILAGRNDTAALKPYNSHILDYSDNGLTMYGAYGRRIYAQIDDMIGRLEKDPGDRRAVLQIWDTYNVGAHRVTGVTNDLVNPTKDPPCNNLVYFKIRDNQLHMTVINRSNDIHWGLYAVNAPTFQMLQQYIAGRLGVHIGKQTHYSDSLHVYIDEPRAKAVTQNLLAAPAAIPYPDHSLMFDDYLQVCISNHEEFASMCSAVLDGEDPTALSPEFLYFANDYLRMYREKLWQPSILNPKYADWIKAAEIFIENNHRGWQLG